MRRLCCLVWMGAILTTPLCPAAEEFKLEKGFVRLDNGKDLKGWTGDKTGWSVVDGAIHLDVEKARGSIYSEKKHSRNVVIRLEFRAAEAADSGVFVHGGQFQVRDYPGSLPDTKKYAPAAKPAGQWNDMQFDVTDRVAVVTLNGKVIEKAWRIGRKADMGIGLQRETGDFDYRYVRLREKE
ncbi:MAG: hypothetical protein A2V70_12440 [Planctomycetes bacterium RBG_13_63_9]|nr:MAG: hypothetical protein A2V70_12440 [Planctomycetes bacterium RBG_13_63_9]